ncbi:MAG: SDR family NAD(P)-dependent oxidoreductase, partial [Verrucomicrobiota bacterium]|nr:SDR family NAD(P)-dependent oxidoreductase [Verrucomicrobiota bacterium]
MESPLSLNGKVAIVTGASSGIGRATAIALAQQGARLVLAARSKDKLEQLARELTVDSLVVVADMTRPEDIDQIVPRTIERFGRVDIVLANAGIFIMGDVVDGDPNAFDQLIQTNVSAVFRLIHAALSHMIKQKVGDIIVTSSISGHKAIHWEPVY